MPSSAFYARSSLLALPFLLSLLFLYLLYFPYSRCFPFSSYSPCFPYSFWSPCSLTFASSATSYFACSSCPFWSPTRFLFFSPSRFAFSTLFSLVSVLHSSCPKSAALIASAGWHEGLGELKCSMLLLLLSSFFVPLLPLFPFFSSTSAPSPQHSWQMLAVMRGSGN